MGTLTCSRCTATTEANSIEEGRSRLNHAVGLVLGKPCEDGKAELYLTGKIKTSKPKDVGKTKKPKTNSFSQE